MFFSPDKKLPCFRFVVVFTLVKIFPRSVSLIGLHGVFWVHAGISIFVCILAGLIMPETQGKTLTELAKMFDKKGIQPPMAPKFNMADEMVKKC